MPSLAKLLNLRQPSLPLLKPQTLLTQLLPPLLRQTPLPEKTTQLPLG